MSILHMDRPMALNIKDPETDHLVRRLGSLAGERLTEAVQVAVRDRLEREEHPTLLSV